MSDKRVSRVGDGGASLGRNGDRQNPEDMRRRAFRHIIAVEPRDADELGHVNNAVYLRYVENVAREHADSVGLGLPRLQELGAVPVVRRHVVTYHRPAFPGDVLAVSTEIVSSRGSRATRHNEVRREPDGELLVDTDTDWIWINPATGRPRAVPDMIRSAFGFPLQADAEKRDGAGSQRT